MRHRLLTVAVDVFSGLSVTDVKDAGGRVIGLVLGTLIDTARDRLVSDALVLDVEPGSAADLDRLVEREIYRHGGSFILVIDCCGEQRIYLDANGSMSLVYDPQMQVAAATTPLLLDEAAYGERFRKDIYAVLDVPRDGWFTAGLTAHRGVCRLLCNFYLDLKTWIPVRHWPAAPIPEAAHPDKALGAIVDETRRSLRALRKAGELVLALTAGNETRLLIACCREFIDDVTFVTVNAPGGELDVEIAKRLAKEFGLRHEVLPYRAATADEAEAWRRRVGHNVSGANVIMHPSVRPLAGKYFAGGLGGEIGRGFLWLDADNSTKIDARGLLTRLKLPDHPAVLEEVEKWLTPVAHYPPLFVLDLAYMELRMSAWAFAQSYATPRPIELHPLISRANYTAMLSLPPAMRRGNGMIRRSIEMTWPELLRIPINRFGDWRDKLTLIRHAISRPDRAVGKIRQMIKS